MTKVSAAQVKELRQQTGVGIMECKNALVENEGNIEKAVVWLRERGLAKAAKKSGRTTAEGVVFQKVSDDGKKGVILEVNCETDFVGKNEEFQNFVSQLAAVAIEHKCSSVDELNKLTINGDTVANTIVSLITKIGENLNLRRVAYYEATSGQLFGYTHMGGKIGVIVDISGGAVAEEIGKDIAMHIAACSPQYLERSEVPADVLKQEEEIARKALLDQGKPESMLDKIITGQMQKFYKDVCLVDQAFVKEPKTSVLKHLQTQGKELGIARYSRFQLGEGIQVEEKNFADEVAAQLNN